MERLSKISPNPGILCSHPCSCHTRNTASNGGRASKRHFWATFLAYAFRFPACIALSSPSLPSFSSRPLKHSLTHSLQLLFCPNPNGQNGGGAALPRPMNASSPQSNSRQLSAMGLFTFRGRKRGAIFARCPRSSSFRIHETQGYIRACPRASTKPNPAGIPFFRRLLQQFQFRTTFSRLTALTRDAMKPGVARPTQAPLRTDDGGIPNLAWRRLRRRRRRIRGVRPSGSSRAQRAGVRALLELAPGPKEEEAAAATTTAAVIFLTTQLFRIWPSEIPLSRGENQCCSSREISRVGCFGCGGHNAKFVLRSSIRAFPILWAPPSAAVAFQGRSFAAAVAEVRRRYQRGE